MLAIAPTEKKTTLLKNRIGPSTVAQLIAFSHSMGIQFSEQKFRVRALKELDNLELKDRVRHLATCLTEAWDLPFTTLAPLLTQAIQQSDLSGFSLWPIAELVSTVGTAAPKHAFPVLTEITRKFTSEFAIRSFLTAHPDITYKQMQRWAQSDNEHDRRLASEGSRPRLPWGTALQSAKKDPSPGIRLLDLLIDDESKYVQTSVANHLNDISKDHPELAVTIAHRWLSTKHNALRATKTRSNRDWIVRHGLRHLVKQGHAGALQIFGLSPNHSIQWKTIRIQRAQLTPGDTLEFAASFALRPRSKTGKQLVVIDYILGYVNARGQRSEKIYKGVKRAIQPGITEIFSKKHVLRPISTRTFYAGTHTLCIQVNGQKSPPVEWKLRISS